MRILNLKIGPLFKINQPVSVEVYGGDIARKSGAAVDS